MAGTRPRLFVIHESHTITREQWDRFAALAIAKQGTITNALADFINGYIEQHATAAPDRADNTRPR